MDDHQQQRWSGTSQSLEGKLYVEDRPREMTQALWRSPVLGSGSCLNKPHEHRSHSDPDSLLSIHPRTDRSGLGGERSSTWSTAPLHPSKSQDCLLLSLGAWFARTPGSECLVVLPTPQCPARRLGL